VARTHCHKTVNSRIGTHGLSAAHRVGRVRKHAAGVLLRKHAMAVFLVMENCSILVPANKLPVPEPKIVTIHLGLGGLDATRG